MQRENRLDLLLEIAYLYYEVGVKMPKIAKRLNISTAQVARLLKQVIEERIVSISFTPPPIVELEWKLVSKFSDSLRKAIVVPTIGSLTSRSNLGPQEIDKEFDLQRQILAMSAAQYFESLVDRKKGTRVCLGCGYTLYQMISSLPNRQREIDIYPAALIGRGPEIKHFSAPVLVSLLWAKCDEKANAYMASLPPLDRGPDDGKKLEASQAQDQYKKWQEENKYLKKVVEKVMTEMKEAELVFTSIGAVGGASSPYKPHKHLTTKDLLGEFNITHKDLKDDHIVGSICYSFFDKHGNIPADLRYFLNIEVEQLKEMAQDPSKHVVVIAGKYKEEALRVVLNQGWCNTLITDTFTARYLLEK